MERAHFANVESVHSQSTQQKAEQKGNQTLIVRHGIFHENLLRLVERDGWLSLWLSTRKVLPIVFAGINRLNARSEPHCCRGSATSSREVQREGPHLGEDHFRKNWIQSRIPSISSRKRLRTRDLAIRTALAVMPNSAATAAVDLLSRTMAERRARSSARTPAPAAPACGGRRGGRAPYPTNG